MVNQHPIVSKTSLLISYKNSHTGTDKQRKAKKITNNLSGSIAGTLLLAFFLLALGDKTTFIPLLCMSSMFTSDNFLSIISIYSIVINQMCYKITIVFFIIAVSQYINISCYPTTPLEGIIFFSKSKYSVVK